MVELGGILQFLDSRSFSSIWFWLALAASWTWTTRAILGVPAEIVHRAHRQPDTDADPSSDALLLLDWLSLNLPRWQVTPREGALVLALGTFLLTSLGILGFGYGLELAQAMFLLTGPFALLTVLRFRLARRLRPILAQAQHGLVGPARTAEAAARAMIRHRLGVLALSALTVGLTAAWGTAWMIVHPHGL